MGKCIIVGAGQFREKTIKVQQDDLVIAADGGLKYLISLDIRPDYIIGDMDSYEDLDKLSKITKDMGDYFIKLPKEKDDTDMLAAIKLGIKKNYDEFLIYGALGGRLDHTIANLQCLDYLITKGKNGEIIDEKVSIRILHNGKINFDKSNKGRISCFAFGGAAFGVTEKGLKYEVSNTKLTTDFPIGVSNEFIGKESFVEVLKGKIIIYKESE